MAAGVLLIVAGVIGILQSVVGLLFVSTLPFFVPFGGPLLLICGVIGVTFSVFALVGGIMATQRRMWGLALTGSILGLFTFGFFGISSLLSLVALILLAVSHREFASGSGSSL